MAKYVKTITSVSIHVGDQNPIHSEGATFVSLEDIGAGPYVSIRQNLEGLDSGQIKVDDDLELSQIFNAVRDLLGQRTVMDHK